MGGRPGVSVPGRTSLLCHQLAVSHSYRAVLGTLTIDGAFGQ